MASSLQAKLRKRAISVGEDHDSAQDTRCSRRQRVLSQPTNIHVAHAIESDHDTAVQSTAFANSDPVSLFTGHSYGSSLACGNASLQNGDSYYTTGPASQIFGPSVLNGTMRLHLTNIFHSHNHELLKPDSKHAQEQGKLTINLP